MNYTITTDSDEIFKSYDVEELFYFIKENKACEFTFFIGYNPISKDEFIKEYFVKSKDLENYIELESILNETIDLVDYGNR